LSDQGLTEALESFAGFPQLVAGLTSGLAAVESEIIYSAKPLKSLTRRGHNEYWPSPDDIRSELDRAVPANTPSAEGRASPRARFDSIFVLWPQHDFARGISVPGTAWGLGMGASDWTNGATYATVANAPTSAWKNETRGEVWLHEWLHGVCHHFAQFGHSMPDGDADGAERHGYTRSQSGGWTEYYRDLMNGAVLENGQRVGIPSGAWV
jgi:hypothetical protein